jgi:PKD-like domain/Secretion system C-terminal sorting domain
MKKSIKMFLCVFFYGGGLIFNGLHAQWSSNSAVNTPVCTSTGNQENVISIPDGSGGVIIGWELAGDIYAQRLNSYGVAQWTANGLLLCNAVASQYQLTITTDGLGGAIFAWTDNRAGLFNNDIYAQRINGAGSLLWATNGAVVCSDILNQSFPRIDADGSNGVFLTWRDERITGFVYSQRLNSVGVNQWTTNGVLVSTNQYPYTFPQIVADGLGGAILSWNSSGDIYSQRINSAGIVQWTVDGIAICTAADNQDGHVITTDGSNGAIITWMDARGGISYEIYAQRINESGVVQWATDGIVIYNIPSYLPYPEIISDGLGGAIITWVDGNSAGLSAQRINGLGLIQWTLNGILICTTAGLSGTGGDYDGIEATTDGAGGAIFIWDDFRSNPGDFYSQRVNSNGVIEWLPNGILVGSALDGQGRGSITSDDNGGAIVAFLDGRNGVGTSDIYAQNFSASGCLSSEFLLSPPITGFTSVCVGTTNTYTAPLIDGFTYSWGGAVGLAISSNINTANIQPTIANDYSILLVVTNSCGAVALSFLPITVNSPLVSSWSNSSTVNTPVSTAIRVQENVKSVSDEAGGAIITWQDGRVSSIDKNIYIQKVDNLGVPLWIADGVAICTASGNQINPSIVSDGAGGAVVTWQDNRGGVTSDIYAQRINSSGIIQWTNNGVLICNSTNDQQIPIITRDGADGSVITWQDKRNGVDFDVYAQRILQAGTVSWISNGVVICNSIGDQQFPTVALDGSGSVITWQDKRLGANSDIYAQRIVTTSGIVSWAANGIVICNAANDQQLPNIVKVSSSGQCAITWQDKRGGVNFDVYVQRINTSGLVSWTANGVVICNSTGDQTLPTLITNGSSGAIITWQDKRSGSTSDIYAQKILSSGIVSWSANGIVICNALNDQQVPSIIADASTGGIITWQDKRSTSNFDIYSQRVNTLGVVQWTANGVALSTATGDQKLPAIISNLTGGAIIAWSDNRAGGLNTNIYAQSICANGSLGSVAPASPASISGVSSTCSNTVNVYSIAAVCDATSYTWILPSGWSGSSTTNSISTTASGTSGNITVKANNSCGTSLAATKAVTVLSCSPANRIYNETVVVEDDINLYPNPTNGNFTLETSDLADKILVMDALGKLILDIAPNSNILNISLQDKQNGLYFVKIITGSNQVVKRMMLNK